MGQKNKIGPFASKRFIAFLIAVIVVIYEYNNKRIIGEEKMPKFDVVIGNPPYQDSTKVAKNTNLWSKFIVLSYNMTNDNGYVSLITPDTWFSPTETQLKVVKDILTKNELIFLNKDISKYFKGIGSSFVSFLLKKNKNKIKTYIKLEDGNEIEKNIQDYDLLPKIMNLNSLSITEKVLLNDNKKINFSSSLRSSANRFENNGKYKAITSKGEIINTNEYGKNANIKKVVVSKISYLYPIYDDGVAATTSYSYWAPVKNKTEGLNMISFLNSKLIQFIFNKICRYTGFNSIGVLKHLPELNFSHSWTDQELYRYFNLTQEEINYIETLYSNE